MARPTQEVPTTSMERPIRPNADDHLRVTRERGKKHGGEESGDRKRDRSRSPLGERGKTQSDEEFEAEVEADWQEYERGIQEEGRQ